MEITFSVKYGEGNEIRVSLSSFSEDGLAELTQTIGPIDLVDISLVRISGNLNADWMTLSSIANPIVQFLKETPDVVMYYYCDEISPIPQMRPGRTMQPAEYRNRLFTILTRKTMSAFPELNAIDTPLQIKTDTGCAYIHLIYLPHMKEKADFIVTYLMNLAADFK